MGWPHWLVLNDSMKTTQTRDEPDDCEKPQHSRNPQALEAMEESIQNRALPLISSCITSSP